MTVSLLHPLFSKYSVVVDPSVRRRNAHPPSNLWRIPCKCGMICPHYDKALSIRFWNSSLFEDKKTQLRAIGIGVGSERGVGAFRTPDGEVFPFPVERFSEVAAIVEPVERGEQSLFDGDCNDENS